MQCAIYKSNKKADYYLFVKEETGISSVPDELLNMLGTLELVMNRELFSDSKLAQSDPQEVIKSLQVKGYYLQIPPTDKIYK